MMIHRRWVAWIGGAVLALSTQGLAEVGQVTAIDGEATRHPLSGDVSALKLKDGIEVGGDRGGREDVRSRDRRAGGGPRPRGFDARTRGCRARVGEWVRRWVRARDRLGWEGASLRAGGSASGSDARER